VAEIRPARADDQQTIKRVVRAARLDPTALDWRHFMIAEIDGRVVGIGQIKELPGCQELGSLVVLPAHRGQGIAAQLIQALESRAGRPLYLMCHDRMEGYYVRFGYKVIGFWQAPWFLRLKLLPALPLRMLGLRFLVMRKE
jgi:amino-acid N-acetyltransferase